MGIFYEYGSLTFRGFLLGVGLAIALSIGGCVGGCKALNNYEYSSGSRAGVVNKTSKKGLIWKTYEGEMALEGIVSSGQSSGANIWKFSVDNQTRHGENKDETVKKLNDALESGQKVKIEYIQVLGGWPWRGSTGHYVQDVQPIVNLEKK